jgi:hypothetical protein
MAIAGRIFIVLGAGSLLLAGLLLLAMWQDHTSGVWFAGMFDNLILSVTPFLAVLGIGGLLYGRHQLRAARDQREFDEAMKAANRPRDGK